MDAVLKSSLTQAVEELRRNRVPSQLPVRLPKPLQLANQIEQLSEQLAAGDAAAAGVLYLMFAPQSDWDDAQGSMELGNQLCELLHPLWVASR